VSERLVSAAARMLDGRSTRRSWLARTAVVGSALAVAPLRYLLEPGSAWAVVTCSDCHGGRCCDGYTEFCCTIDGGSNSCPSYTYMGGWWKCTSYGGARLCHEEGVRYYIDCNRRRHRHCPHGCSCAAGSCSNRATCCNVFRYGQCNADVPVVTEVVCRVVKCVNPCRLYPDVCSCTSFVDNHTCRHEAGCLHEGAQGGRYRGLGGSGGAIG
jgi:hypothetical protein